MIARLLLSGLAALLLAGCEADSSLPGADLRQATPAIYEITGPDGGTGWLFGTAHALPDGVDWRTETIEAALAQAGVLVVEIADLADTQAAFEAFRARAYAEGLPPLVDRAGPQRRELIAELVERAGGDAEDYAEMKSWAAAMTLAAGLRTGDPENGVDRALIASGKPVIGLETFEAQYAMFDDLTQTQQADLLVGMALEAREDRSQALMEAWIAGDDALIEEQADSGILAFPALREQLLVRRNLAWAERIDALVRDGRRPFFAVGAAHIIGEDGLLALLEPRGYTISRL